MLRNGFEEKYRTQRIMQLQEKKYARKKTVYKENLCSNTLQTQTKLSFKLSFNSDLTQIWPSASTGAKRRCCSEKEPEAAGTWRCEEQSIMNHANDKGGTEHHTPVKYFWGNTLEGAKRAESQVWSSKTETTESTRSLSSEEKWKGAPTNSNKKSTQKHSI